MAFGTLVTYPDGLPGGDKWENSENETLCTLTKVMCRRPVANGGDRSGLFGY
jgi:hypothetical protein